MGGQGGMNFDKLEEIVKKNIFYVFFNKIYNLKKQS